MRWLLPLLVGCSAQGLPDPVVHEVSPRSAWTGEDAAVVILGESFLPQVGFDAADRDVVEVNRGFSAFLVGPAGSGNRSPLTGVALLPGDDEHEPFTRLRAVVDQGKPQGLYDVEIISPGGRTGYLENAFTVTATRADSLSLEVAELVHPVGAEASVDLQLLDVAGEIVRSDALVQVSITGDSLELVESDHTLADAMPTEDGTGWIGTLRLGSGTLFYRRTSPGEIRITASAMEPAGVSSGEARVAWELGDVASIRMTLPDEEFTAEAGVPFGVVLEPLDAEGNLVDDQLTSVTLEDSCEQRSRSVNILGRETVDVILTRATTVFCETNMLTTSAFDPPGVSEPFEISAGEAASFQVVAVVAGGQVTAGSEVDSLVTSYDAFGNTASWVGEITMGDSAGSPTTACTKEAPQLPAVCSMVPQVAREEVTVTARALPNLQGESNLFAVDPSGVLGSISLIHDPTVAAGEVFEIYATLADEFGNTMGGAPFLAITATDASGTLLCGNAIPTTTGVLFRCTGEVADTTSVTVLDPSTSLSATTGPVQLVNGPLAAVEWIAPATAIAGEEVAFSVQGFDVYGNPYLSQSNPSLVLEGTSFSESSATLDAAGEAEVLGFFEQAGSHSIEAFQNGVSLGASASVVVSAAEPETLLLTVEADWVWVDEPATVRVEALDAFGNRSGEDLTASVTTASGQVPVTVPVVNGVGSAAMTWTSVELADDVTALSGALVGSTVIDAVARCVVDAPVADLLFGGQEAAVACFDEPSQTALVSAEFGGSVAGPSGIVQYTLATPASVTRSASPSITADLGPVGHHEVAGLVVGGDGCGTEIAAEGWVGFDDGSATGPLTITTSTNVLPTFGSLTVTMSDVTDCANDAADGAQVNVRTTAGELLGPVPSGAGLEVTLDAFGSAVFDLETSGGVEAGAIDLVGWVEDDSAGGRTSISLVGDSVRPIVIAQNPSGASLGATVEITVEFDEPLLDTTIIPSAFSLDGPVAVNVIDAELLPGDREVRLVLDQPADGSLGVWVLRVSSSVRDAAGNLLDGAFIEAASDYEGAFGLVDVGPEAIECAVAEPVGGLFRPDGDDGLDTEADTVSIALESDVAPAWWVASVKLSGDVLNQEWSVPLGAVDTWSWDGRDAAGHVVPNGTYLVSIQPDDGLGNRGDACVVDVFVDNGGGQ